MAAEWIIVMFTAVSMIAMIVGSWVALNVKLKEFDMKIRELETKMDNYQKDRNAILDKIEKSNELMQSKLDRLTQKVDEKFDMILVLKTEHDAMKATCRNNRP